MTFRNKYALILLLFACLSQGFACDPKIWQRVAEASSFTLPKKLVTLVSSYEDKPWHYSFSLSKEIKGLDAKFQKLTPEEKEQLRIYYEENPAEEWSLSELLALKLHSKRCWLKYLERASKYGIEGFPFLLELKPVLEKMPKELRDSILEMLKREYPTSSKKKTMDLGMEPRRVWDTLLSVFYPPEEYIQKAVDEGSTPKEALEKYFDLIQPYFGAKSPLSVEDVIAIADQAKNTLQTEGNKIPENLRPHPLAVALFGSIANGKATENSDVDTAWSDESLYTYKIPGTGQSLFSLMNTRVNAAIIRRHPEFTHWKADMDGPLAFLHSEKDGVPLYTLVSPLLVRISPDKVELIIPDRTKIMASLAKGKSFDVSKEKSYRLE